MTAKVTSGRREIVKLAVPLCAVSLISMTVQEAFARIWILTIRLSYSRQSLFFGSGSELEMASAGAVDAASVDSSGGGVWAGSSILGGSAQAHEIRSAGSSHTLFIG